MTINFTDPMEAIDFSDDESPSEFHGTIRQTPNNEIIVDLHSNGAYTNRKWEVSDKNVVGEIASLLGNRINLDELRTALKRAHFCIE